MSPHASLPSMKVAHRADSSPYGSVQKNPAGSSCSILPAFLACVACVNLLCRMVANCVPNACLLVANVAQNQCRTMANVSRNQCPTMANRCPERRPQFALLSLSRNRTERNATPPLLPPPLGYAPAHKEARQGLMALSGSRLNVKC